MSKKNIFDMDNIDIAWCPGCGDYPILATLKEALVELDIKPNNLVMVSGIGQAAKTPQYLNCNFFNGLHGRSLPAAWAIKATNPELVVIAESGDGCSSYLFMKFFDGNKDPRRHFRFFPQHIQGYLSERFPQR